MTTHRAPKLWVITYDETITSSESWRQNLIDVMSLDKNFAPFLDAMWQKKTERKLHTGLENDGSSVPEAQGLTDIQTENAYLD